MQRALALLALLVLAYGQTTFTAGGSGSFSSTGALPLFPSISAVSTNAATITANVQAPVSTASNFVLAGSGSGNNAALSLSLGVGQLLIVPVSFTSSAATTLTLTVSYNQAFTALLSGAIQFNLFLGSTDASGQVTYGAVPFTVSGGTYTYTLNLGANVATNLYFAPFDGNSATTSGSGSSSTTSGSASFNYGKSFYPVAFNHAFNLQAGTQYAFGNNIQVTPASSSSGNFQVNFNGGFNGQSGATSSASSAPANAYAFQNAYYTFSGSGSSNVLQWKSTTSDKANFYINGTVATTAAAYASVSGNSGAALSWFKASGDSTTQASAQAWGKVSSTTNFVSAVNGNGQASVAVYTTASTYSQWAVGASGNGAASLSVGVLLVVGAVLALLL